MQNPDKPIQDTRSAEPVEAFVVQPTAHVDGLLPPRYLSPGETLLYSTRPSFIGHAFPTLIGTVGAVVVLVLLFLAFPEFGGDPSFSTQYLPGVSIVLLAIGVFVSLRDWFYTVYAVSTSRIIIKHGAWTRRLIDIPHAAIQSVMFEETAFGRAFGYGTLQFSSASIAGLGWSRSVSRPGVISWRAVPNPLDVRALCEAARSKAVSG